MAKNGFRAFDSDMHVFEPADLYTKYMNPKWGERIPRGAPAQEARNDALFSRRRQSDSPTQRGGKFS